MWDEANTVYELDDPPVTATNQTKKKAKAVNPSAPIRQNQMNQRVNRPNYKQGNEVYKS